jgi:hypothetical protein
VSKSRSHPRADESMLVICGHLPLWVLGPVICRTESLTKAAGRQAY